ncbi:uncharacterized protein LOC120207299 [Hibiscus syriacus]|nr:uncharacterized protein LOC120207299 [Hibiscus syriacus]
MSKLSSSKNFVNAVWASVDEIRRLVESKMTCSCVPKENCVGLDRLLADNAGIKEGVLVPEGGIENVSVGLFEPKEVLCKLKQVSQALSTSNLLECAVLKGWLSAYNRSIGRPRILMDHELLLNPDTEENFRTFLADMGDYSEEVGNPITTPAEKDWISSLSGPKFGQGIRTSTRHSEITENAMHQGRKQKSIAEILKTDIGVQAHKVTKSAKQASFSRRKKAKVDYKANDDGGSNSSFVPRKGKQTELSGSHAETDAIGAKKEMDKDYSSRGRKMKSKQASDNNGDDSGKEDTNTVSAKRKEDPNTVIGTISRNDSFSRERKKSKYLSPPYTSSTGKLRKSGIEDESIEASNDTRSRETMIKATGNPVISERNELSEEVHAEQEASNELRSLIPKLYLDRIIDLEKAETPANEVLVAVRSIALSPQYQRDNGSFELIVKFLSAFRSSVYRDGSDYKMYNQLQQHKRRKSPDFSAVSLGKDRSTAGLVPSGHKSHKKKVGKKEETEMGQSKPREATWTSLKKTQKPKPYKRKRKQTVTAAVLKKNDKEADEDKLPAALFVTFGPGSSLPTKDDLVRIYSKYGALDMEDTDMFYNNFCARIVFLRTSDAEEAFSSSQNDSPFGSANVSFRLRLHVTTLSQNQREIPSSKNSSSLVEDGIERSTKSSAPGNLQLNHIKKKLEMLTSMLEIPDEKMSSETKSKIQNEIKGLLEVVNTMVESSS